MTEKPESGGSSPATGNLIERLVAVAAEVDRVEQNSRTASTQGNKPAAGIDDYEDAIRESLARHGVIAMWSDIELKPYTEPTRNGEMRMWWVTREVEIFSAGDPSARIVKTVQDVGTTPSGAKSFAVKEFWRRTFHLTGGNEDEQKAATEVQPNRGAANAPTGQNPPPGTSAKSNGSNRTAARTAPPARRLPDFLLNVSTKTQADVREFLRTYCKAHELNANEVFGEACHAIKDAGWKLPNDVNKFAGRDYGAILRWLEQLEKVPDEEPVPDEPEGGAWEEPLETYDAPNGSGAEDASADDEFELSIS